MNKKRRLQLAAAALAILALGLFFWSRTEKAPLPVDAGTAGEASSPAAAAPEAKPAASAEFPAEASSAIERCLGKPAGNFSELEQLVAAETGPASSNQLEWKVVEFEDQAGQPYRIRLAREYTEAGQAQLTLSLFSVDAEGLPDRIPLPPEESRSPDLEAMKRVLHDKRIRNEVENTRYRYAQGKELVLEKENSVTQKLQFMGGKIRLACESNLGSPSCHCVR